MPGITNDATHYVDLWMSNDRGLYEQAMELAAAASHEEYPRAALADALREMIETTAERDFPTLFDHGNFVGDIVTNALAGVDWNYLAHSFLECVAESESFA